jgi:hypothetical protein
MRSFRPSPGRPVKPKGNTTDIVRQARNAAQQRATGYRERSLALYGWICGRCAREFEANNLHLLTVHHRDGNHNYNPPDGSNWENLCVYCHEAEHSKNLLADYIDGATRKR